MFVIGVTGPSGAGKSVVATHLGGYGVNVIDADSVYHSIITPPSRCLDELVHFFGKSILRADGSLNRAALSKLVFGEDNREKLEVLNRITHKFVVLEIRRIINGFSVLGLPYCVIDAPLLIEADLVKDCDIVISVLADKAVRAERISARDSITLDAAMLRINSQKPDDFYSSVADITVYNNGDAREVVACVDSLLSERGVVLT